MSDIEAMRRLLYDYGSQRKREEQAFQDGFRAGWNDAYDVGYGRAHHEMAEAWSVIAQKVKALGKGSS